MNDHVPPQPLLDQAVEQASAFAQRGADAVRDSSQNLRDSARRASDGAVLMALVGLLARHGGRG